MLIPVDVTTANCIPDGMYPVTVTKLQYHILTGSGWKKDNYMIVDDETFTNSPEFKMVDGERKIARRLQFTLTTENNRNLLASFYIADNCLGFLYAFLKACNITFSKQGFVPEDCLNKQLNIQVSIKTTPNGDEQNNIESYSRI